METKTLALTLILVVLAVLAPITYVLATSNTNGSSRNEDWLDEMQEHMDDHWDEIEDEEWFDEMTEHMEDHMDDIEDEDWFDEMEEHMDDMMGSHDHDDDSRNSRHGCH